MSDVPDPSPHRRHRPLGAWLAFVVIVLGLVFLYRASDRIEPPEPVSFAVLAQPDFETGGALTDAWADYDGDGDPDRFVGFNGAPARLYRNDRPYGFAEVAGEVGLTVERRVRTAAWGDFDADGDPDLFLGFADGTPVTALYRNDGGRFSEVATESGLAVASGATRQAVWVDYDDDGDLDLFLAVRDGANRLFRNDGGAFSDVAAALGVDDPRHSVGAVWFDAEGDGDLDLYVGNMDGDANGLWVQEEGRFTDRAEALGLAAGGRAVGTPDQGTVRPCAVDYDGDGFLDLYLANYGPNGLFRNPGTERSAWTDETVAVGLGENTKDDTCAWADFDHDGRVDLYVNGTVTGGIQYPDRLFRREAGPAFREVTPDALRVPADHGATWVDYDLDGDVDLALTGVTEEGMHRLVQNLLRPEIARHHVAVRVLGPSGAATMAGTLVRVYAAGSDRVIASGLVDAGSGYNAQSDLPVHLGLPGSGVVDVQAVAPGRDGPRTVWARGILPEDYRGRMVTVRVGGE